MWQEKDIVLEVPVKMGRRAKRTLKHMEKSYDDCWCDTSDVYEGDELTYRPRRALSETHKGANAKPTPTPNQKP